MKSDRHASSPRTGGPPLLLHGMLLCLAGTAALVFHAVAALLAPLLSGVSAVGTLKPVQMAGTIAVIAGLVLALIDLYVLLPAKRRDGKVMNEPPLNRRLTVVLTAYNDEASIGLAVEDFRRHPLVERVIVVDNNSRDRTKNVAEKCGAEVVVEEKPGYGHCVFRALSEGVQRDDCELTLLCEGDMTFRANDIDKFMAYISHAEMVNGTRIVEQLRARKTQLTTFMFYGNFFVGKLLEAKHIGRGTFTDVGTTYKLCRNSSLRALLPLLDPSINLEFNAHFLDTALRHRFLLVECPVTFHGRVGQSKGGNTGNWRALTVGLKMIYGICVTWRTR